MGGTPFVDPDPQEWLNGRHQPGNWIAIRPDEEIPASIVGWDRTIINMFQMAFTPEIERRRDAGTLEPDFFVQSVQLLQAEGRPAEIRFNDEVRGVLRLDLKDAFPGRPLTVGDIQHMVSFDLVDEELDCGHFTLFWTGKGWNGSFDFRQGRARSAQLVALAQEFIATARFSAENGYAGPAVDNLFSGCELLCKVQLILSHNPAGRHKTHNSVSRQINSWTKLGNGDPDFVKLFNRLSSKRGQARYDASDQVGPPSDDDLAIAERVSAAIAEAVKQRG